MDVFDVVGTFELLLMAKELAESGQYHAIAYTAFVVDRDIFRLIFRHKAWLTD